MAPMPVPPDDGGEDHVSGLQQGLRLSDAEEIAASRLDGAAEGSLREALAVASAERAGDAASQRGDAIGLAGESIASGPLIRLVDARSAELGHTRAPRPFDAFSAMPMPPLLDVGIALVRPVENQRAVVGDTPPAVATAPLPHAVPAQSIEPLTSALDAAVRLAADASVAAETLENLKRLLEHKQHLESQLTQLAAGSAPAPLSDSADAPAPPPSLPPLPLPLHAEQDAAGRPAAGSVVLPPPPRRGRRTPPEHRAFDVRGFMAGFALSWAFGAVLYLFMTAG
jgi:hypothetical protein